MAGTNMEKKKKSNQRKKKNCVADTKYLRRWERSPSYRTRIIKFKSIRKTTRWTRAEGVMTERHG